MSFEMYGVIKKDSLKYYHYLLITFLNLIESEYVMTDAESS